MKPDTTAPINHNIKAKRIILIDEEGKRKGEFFRDDAIQLAKEADLDLVMVSVGEVPVCKVMDYGKYLYQQKKKLKSNQASAPKMKEVQISPVIGDHDLEIKCNHIRDFIERGDKVKVILKFKGRQRYHQDLGFNKFQQMLSLLSDSAQQDGNFQIFGSWMSMNLIKKG